jgi:DNA (cytosine-5)-methyltransferase 1
VKPRLLDLVCGAGGCSVGYARAGFEVVGVDVVSQPNYPFEFVQGDALSFLRSDHGRFDAIHASPPCQAYSALRTLQGDREYVDLVAPIRDLLIEAGLPYVIENVEGAPLIAPIRICGSGIGLPLLRRHRLFECSFPAFGVPCAHGIAESKRFPALNGADRKRGGRSGIVGVYGNGGDKRADLWPEAMGIDWMARQELTQAIPPAYTEHIGGYLMAEINALKAAA